MISKKQAYPSNNFFTDHVCASKPFCKTSMTIMADKFNFGASLYAGSFQFPGVTLLFPLHQQVLMGRTNVNMAAGRVESLYVLAAFTTVRNCNVFKSEFRSLPNAVQCDIYRTVSISFFFCQLLLMIEQHFVLGEHWTLMFTKFFAFMQFAAFFYVAFRHW